MRIALYSPLPPERSGIADYSFELLEELRHRVDVVAVVADNQLLSARAPEGVELVAASMADDLVVDVNCYQMGNNPKYHRFFWKRAFEEPGLLLLHDPSLADFTAEMCGGAESAIFRDEVHYDCPHIGVDDDLPLVDVGGGRKDLDRLEVLLARRIIESNIRTLVHSSAMEHELRRRYPGNEIRTIQLPAPVLRRTVGRSDDGTVRFGVFGGINYYKRVRPLVDAFIDVHKKHPHVRMVIAGRADEHLLERELRSIAARPELCGALEVHTELSLSALEREMLNCDVGITLRWPTAGEMSATLMRTFGAGRPAIVSDVLQFRELDDRYCWRVTTDFTLEHERLVDLMSSLASDPARCRRGGEAARAFVEREATYGVVAERYVEHLVACAEKRSAKRATHSAHRLTGAFPLGVNVIAPSLSGELLDASQRMAGALRRAGVDVVDVRLDVAAHCEDGELDPPPDAMGGDDARDGEDCTRQAENTSPGRSAAGAGIATMWDAPDTTRDGERIEVERAVRALDPADRPVVHAGPHRFDLYFVDPREVDRLARLAKVRRSRGRRIIAVLSPEITPFGVAYTPLLEVTEQIWAPSEFASVVAEMSSDAVVHIVPWPIEAPREARVELRRESRRCSFVTVIGPDVTIERANPFGALEAYRRAFSHRERTTDVDLTIVFEGAATRPDAVQVLREAADAVNCKVLTDLTPNELRVLICSSDVYLSLHRTEGFGLRLVDAMANAMPIVATGYSGNLDYMDDRSAVLVGYGIEEPRTGDHYLDPDAERRISKGAFWANPDVGGAANGMRRLAYDSERRRRLGESAAAAVQSLTPERVGSVALEALQKMPRRAMRRSRLDRRPVGVE